MQSWVVMRMLEKLLKSKIHRARITGRDLEYEGSLTLDPDLMEAAGLSPFESVWVYNISNGARFETYIIPGERGKGEVVLNGAAARLGEVGDKIIIAAYAWYSPEEIKRGVIVKLVFVDENNRIKDIRESCISPV